MSNSGKENGKVASPAIVISGGTACWDQAFPQLRPQFSRDHLTMQQRACDPPYNAFQSMK